MENPYQATLEKPATVHIQAGRFLFFYSIAIILICCGLVLLIVATIASSIYFGGIPPLPATVLMAIFIAAMLIIAISQFLAVIERSEHWTSIAIGIATLGVIGSLITAVVYPITEYYFDNGPPGMEIIGLVFYTFLAGPFYLNRRVLRNWRQSLKKAGTTN